MGYKDFERCTPSEFMAAVWQWRRSREMEERGAWERARMTCLCILQPYSGKELSPRDIMEFPWDVAKGVAAGDDPVESREEVMERYRRAKAAAGLCGGGGDCGSGLPRDRER